MSRGPFGKLYRARWTRAGPARRRRDCARGPIGRRAPLDRRHREAIFPRARSGLYLGGGLRGDDALADEAEVESMAAISFVGRFGFRGGWAGASASARSRLGDPTAVFEATACLAVIGFRMLDCDLIGWPGDLKTQQ